jgi:hypothetical protein
MRYRHPMSQPSRPRSFLGLPKLPARFAGIVMPLLLSVLMTAIISMVSTPSSIGASPRLVSVWLHAWALSWIVAFPTLLMVLPLVRKATAALVDTANG